jgi:hypothetical protein
VRRGRGGSAQPRPKRRTLPRLCLLGRSGTAVCEPRRAEPHGPAGVRLRVRPPRPLHALHRRGLRLTIPSGEWALPLACAATLPVHNASQHATPATLARSPPVGMALAWALDDAEGYCVRAPSPSAVSPTLSTTSS